MKFDHRAVKGQKHISADAWNNIREVVEAIADGISIPDRGVYNNQLIVTIKNTGYADLQAFGILEIDGALYPGRSDSEWRSGAINSGVELTGTTPTGDVNKSIAVLLQSTPIGGIGKAVVSGPVACKVYVDDADKDYQYAQAIDNQSGYLRAADTGPARIVYKQSGEGEKWAYVILDREAEASTMYCAYSLPNTDTRPEGAFTLNYTDTYVYCDDLDSFARQSIDGPPSVYNPLSFPPDRPAIIAKVEGFPGESETDAGSTSPIGDYVAISADTREHVLISEPTAGLGQIVAGDCLYIEYNNIQGEWVGQPGALSASGIIAVCQRSIPAGWTKWPYRMPFYPLEANIGVPPNVDTSIGTLIGLNHGNFFGLAENRKILTSEKHDFWGVIISSGSKARSIRRAGDVVLKAVYKSGGYIGFYYDGILDTNHLFTCPSLSTGNYSGMCPDLYDGDEIAVLFDTVDNIVIRILECPLDLIPGTTILAAYPYTIGNCRGWSDITNDYWNSITDEYGQIIVLDTGTFNGWDNSIATFGNETNSTVHREASMPTFKDGGFKVYRKIKSPDMP